MARAVFDPTSSSLLSSHRAVAPTALYLALTRGRFHLIASPQLLDELDHVLARSKFRRYASREEARSFVDAVARLALLTEDPPATPGATTDPGDDYLVTLARAADADVLVSETAICSR